MTSKTIAEQLAEQGVRVPSAEELAASPLPAPADEPEKGAVQGSGEPETSDVPRTSDVQRIHLHPVEDESEAASAQASGEPEAEDDDVVAEAAAEAGVAADEVEEPLRDPLEGLKFKTVVPTSVPTSQTETPNGPEPEGDNVGDSGEPEVVASPEPVRERDERPRGNGHQDGHRHEKRREEDSRPGFFLDEIFSSSFELGVEFLRSLPPHERIRALRDGSRNVYVPWDDVPQEVNVNLLREFVFGRRAQIKRDRNNNDGGNSRHRDGGNRVLGPQFGGRR